ncbi:probable palmitoyltransferase ZDHHC12 [Rhinatrema bivittatum]|uniref:probable palmitoyltransferase ZDHHC12 n=1 Tax=Rhinatrema bivittatum TaxID=194408 RepID=UPI00112713FE|nr:probable palmitoyltransferase ZDHHC12 [Rhinatrema bivittatum]
MFRNVFSAGFLVRTAHTVLTWAVTLVLFLHSADLRHQEESGDLLRPLLFVLLVLFSVLLYFAVSLMDPGYVTCDGDMKVLAINEDQEEMILQVPQPLRLRRCGYCMLQQPMRARHCQACGHCVRRYDHHCPWIENCVGERNHPLFIIYLLIQLVVLLWAFRLAWSGFFLRPSWTEWLQLNMFLLLAFAIIAVFTVVVMLLLVSHLYLVSCNVTTWEFMSHHRISYLKHCSSQESPFDRGIGRNLHSFFCTCHSVAWEKIYFQDGNNFV